MPMISKVQRQTNTWSPPPAYWHSRFSPYPYEVVEKAKEAVKCFGYGQNFANKIAFNLVMKHIDRTNQGSFTSSIFFIWLDIHCIKIVRIRSYSSPHFPTFGLNTERYTVFLRIQSECEKMRIKITPNTDAFHAVIDIHQCFFLSSFYKPYSLFWELFCKSVDIIATLRAFTCLLYQFNPGRVIWPYWLSALFSVNQKS